MADTCGAGGNGAGGNGGRLPGCVTVDDVGRLPVRIGCVTVDDGGRLPFRVGVGVPVSGAVRLGSVIS
ncbi:MAG TPA: hypothetical protein VF885_25855, partial [Arthrobacter sp.]